MDEFTAGIERELFKDVRFSVTGIWREDKNVQASVYPDARWTLGSVTTSTAGDDPALQGKTVPVYQWANRSASEDNILITNLDGFRYLDPNGQLLGHGQRRSARTRRRCSSSTSASATAGRAASRTSTRSPRAC